MVSGGGGNKPVNPTPTPAPGPNPPGPNPPPAPGPNPPGPNPPAALTFDVKVIDLKPIKGTYLITPSNDEATFAFGVMTKQKYDAQKAIGDKKNPPEGIFSFDKGWNQQLAQTGESWQEAAKRNGYYKTGVQSGEIVSGDCINPMDIRPNLDCVVYYYQISETSEKPDSEIFIYEFKTPPIEMITLGENDIALEVSNAYWKAYDDCSLDAKITLTGNAAGKTVIVYVMRRGFLEWYINAEQFGKKKPDGTFWKPIDAIYKVTSEWIRDNKALPIYTGDQLTIKIQNEKLSMDDNEKAAALVVALYDKDSGVLSVPKWKFFNFT